MKKNALILTLLCFVSSLSFAQLQEGGIPESFNMSDNLFDDIKTYYYNFDNSQIKAKNDSALDIGVAESVMINFIDEATKTIGEDSTKIYRLAIEVNNVYGIGLYFDDFHLPTNGKLYFIMRTSQLFWAHIQLIVLMKAKHLLYRHCQEIKLSLSIMDIVI